MARPTLNLVGAGRVGQTLARLWQQQGTFAIQDVLTTSLSSAQAACGFIGGGTAVDTLQALRAADVWMLAVPDAQLAHMAQSLAQAIAQQRTPQSRHGACASALRTAPRAVVPVVFHCSGALDAGQLAPLAALGWHTASAHCILSFAQAATAVAQFAGTPCALEGDAGACNTLRPAFTAIGAQCFDLASEHKLLYHAAAVFATNFLPVLQTVAEEAWQATGVPAPLIPGLRASLLAKAVANITTLGPAAALTGPAARGDTAAIARQALAVGAWDAQAGAAYEALSALALRIAAHRTTPPA
ncbi:MAG: hypothetical protein A3F78_04375 [Burkholderiales bacterium RIFCSPLOWO2_12_FULL_61_40]|nr:MAG: hypothetical protein A3F78_04375 [Burkholderiales bacterium RIFCSPLOWO2_12_FULL_61_40]